MNPVAGNARINMPMRLAAALGLVGAVAIPLAGHATATPPVAATSSTLSKQTVDGHDVVVVRLTLAPGGSTGWHTHQGEAYGLIESGVLTHYGADCRVDGTYRAGDPITDPTGPDHVHLARNLGAEPVVLEVTFIGPAGQPTADSADDPGCGFS